MILTVTADIHCYFFLVVDCTSFKRQSLTIWLRTSSRSAASLIVQNFLICSHGLSIRMPFLLAVLLMKYLETADILTRMSDATNLGRENELDRQYIYGFKNVYL